MRGSDSAMRAIGMALFTAFVFLVVFAAGIAVGSGAR